MNVRHYIDLDLIPADVWYESSIGLVIEVGGFTVREFRES